MSLEGEHWTSRQNFGEMALLVRDDMVETVGFGQPGREALVEAGNGTKNSKTIREIRPVSAKPRAAAWRHSGDGEIAILELLWNQRDLAVREGFEPSRGL
jgi:hypothetical protein